MNGRPGEQHDADEATGVCTDRSAALRRGLGRLVRTSRPRCSVYSWTVRAGRPDSPCSSQRPLPPKSCTWPTTAGRSRLPRPAGEPDGVCGRPECRGRVVQLPKPRTDLTERVVAAQPIRPWTGLAQGVAQGLAGQERQAFAALVIEAAGARSAVETDVFQMPQHRVHGRRPRLRGAADFVAGAYGSETAPAGQPSFGHLKVLPRSAVPGDRITGSARVEPCREICAGLPGLDDPGQAAYGPAVSTAF